MYIAKRNSRRRNGKGKNIQSFFKVSKTLVSSASAVFTFGREKQTEKKIERE